MTAGCFRLERSPGGNLHPQESAALSRRTPDSDIGTRTYFFACPSYILPNVLQMDTGGRLVALSDFLGAVSVQLTI
jgi:hypothetical protein